MKLLKKLFVIILLVFSFALFGCKKEEKKEEPRNLKVLLPAGTPLLSVGGLIGNSNYTFEVVNGQDPLSAAFIAGEYDLIIAPINLGAKLYLAGKSNYKLEAVLTTNNTYIASYDKLESLEDLKDKKILAYGVNSSPWLALNALNDKYNLNLTIETQSSVADVATIFAKGESDYDLFLLAEPNVTTLKEKQKKEFNVIDVASFLKDDISFICQACLFVNANSNVTASELKVFEDNIKSMNEKPEEYAKKVADKNDFFRNLGEDIIKKAIPKCNINYLKAKNNLTDINKFFDLLNRYSPKVLDGKTPDEGLYN